MITLAKTNIPFTATNLGIKNDHYFLGEIQIRVRRKS